MLQASVAKSVAKKCYKKCFKQMLQKVLQLSVINKNIRWLKTKQKCSKNCNLKKQQHKN